MKMFFTVLHWLLFIGYWCIFIKVILRIITKNYTVQSTIAWLLTIYVFPVIGIIMYLLFGECRFDRKRYQHSEKFSQLFTKLIEIFQDHCLIYSDDNSEYSSLLKLCKNRQGISGTVGNYIQIFASSNQVFQTLISDIHSAKKNIKMIFYVWQIGGFVDQISEAIISAARRGVHCRLILDSIGSMKFFRSNYFKLMKLAGVNIVKAMQIDFFHIFIRRIDMRQHRKVILIDDDIVYTGSMNMADPKFFKQESGVGQWIDIMIRIKGPIAIFMQIIFSHDWKVETGEYILPDFVRNKITPFNVSSSCVVQAVASGPGFPKDIIHQVLLTSIYLARKQLIITTPYLIPSDNLFYALCTAAQRGVDVHIVIPYCNNSILVNWASRFFFTKLIKSGISIHRFTNGLLHTKSILIDGKLSLIGTANFDIRSLWINFEVILIIYGRNFGEKLEKIQRDYFSHSRLVILNDWLNRPYLDRVLEKICQLFSLFL